MGRRNRTSSVGLEADRQAPETCVLPLHYTHLHIERVTGIEPAPAHWRYADQDLKSCVLPLHYTRFSY